MVQYTKRLSHGRLLDTTELLLTIVQTRCNTKQSIYHSARSLYIFRVSTTPIIRSIQNSSVTRLAWPRWREVTVQKMWPVPDAVVTVLCTPDDGCGWHPKSVEWTCRIINRLLCVASRLDNYLYRSAMYGTINIKYNRIWRFRPLLDISIVCRSPIVLKPQPPPPKQRYVYL